MGAGLPRNPSLFQYYIKERHTLTTDAQIIASKGKLNVLSNTKDHAWKNKYRPYSYCGPNGNGLSYGPDRETMVKVKETLSSATPPHLMMVNLLGVDVNGHGNDWKKYLDNIKYTDAYALEIWNAIQANPMLKDKTTLFITNDHGRHTEGHKNGFVNHGDGCDGCRGCVRAFCAAPLSCVCLWKGTWMVSSSMAAQLTPPPPPPLPSCATGLSDMMWGSNKIERPA